MLTLPTGHEMGMGMALPLRLNPGNQRRLQMCMPMPISTYTSSSQLSFPSTATVLSHPRAAPAPSLRSSCVLIKRTHTGPTLMSSSPRTGHMLSSISVAGHILAAFQLIAGTSHQPPVTSHRHPASGPQLVGLAMLCHTSGCKLWHISNRTNEHLEILRAKLQEF